MNRNTQPTRKKAHTNQPDTTSKAKQKAREEELEEELEGELDETLKETFPASDATAKY